MIEEYGRFVKQKAKAILSEERVRVEPWSCGLRDGPGEAGQAEVVTLPFSPEACCFTKLSSSFLPAR